MVEEKKPGDPGYVPLPQYVPPPPEPKKKKPGEPGYVPQPEYVPPTPPPKPGEPGYVPAVPTTVSPSGAKVYRGEEAIKRGEELDYYYMSQRVTGALAGKESGIYQISGTNYYAIVSTTGEVKIISKGELEKYEAGGLTWKEALELGLVSPVEYRTGFLTEPTVSASVQRKYEEEFQYRKQHYEELWKESPRDALKYALDYDLISKDQYEIELEGIERQLEEIKHRKKLAKLYEKVSELAIKYLPSAKIPEEVPEWIKGQWSISTFKPDGTEETHTFTSPKALKSFIEKEQEKQMKEAKWTDTWDEFVAHNEMMKDTVSKLVAKGTAKIEGKDVVLVKPVNVLTDEEIDLALKIGMDVPILPPGISWIVYQYGKGRIAKEYEGYPEDYLREQEKLWAKNAALYDAFFMPLSSVVQLLTGQGERSVTTTNIKYLVDLSPTEQAELYVAGPVTAYLGGNIALYPLGLTAAGANTAASSIASKLGITASSRVKDIASFLVAHPKATQAILWAPIAGMEAHHVYQDIQAGRPVDEIIVDEAQRIASIYGGIEGFKTGFREGLQLLPRAEKAELTRLMTDEIIQTPHGSKRVLVLKTKDIPKWLADIIQTELDPITGKEIVVGIGIQEGAKIPITREYGDLLVDLVQGKAVGVEPVRQALVSVVGPEGYDLLVARGLNIERMSAEEIAWFTMKELGYGTPWYKAPTEVLMPKGRFEIIGVMAPLEGDAFNAAMRKTGDLYHYLVSQGMSGPQALKWATEIMTRSPTALAFMAQTSGLSEESVQTVVRASLTYGAMVAGGTSIYQILHTRGASSSEISAVISIAVQLDNPEVYAKQLSALSESTLELVVPRLNVETLVQAIPKLDRSTVKKMLPHLGVEPLTRVLPKIHPEDLAAVVPKLSSETLNEVLTKLSTEQLSQVVPRLDVANLIAVLPKLSTTQITAVVPKLTQDQLTVVIRIHPWIFTLLPPKFQEGIRQLKKVPPTRFLEPYKVTFQYYMSSEVHKVHARSFFDAINLGFRLKKKPEEAQSVEVRKLKRYQEPYTGVLQR